MSKSCIYISLCRSKEGEIEGEIVTDKFINYVEKRFVKARRERFASKQLFFSADATHHTVRKLQPPLSSPLSSPDFV
jgi:hypothetical protein